MQGGALMSSVELFQKGGPVMYLLFLCSLTVAAIAIDRWLCYKKAGLGAADLLRDITNFSHSRQADEMQKAAQGKDNVVAVLTNAGTRANAAGENVQIVIDAAYSDLAMELRTRLNYLSMIVTMAPLLGLLGTISGMIQSFSIFNLQAGQPMAITGGIGEALIATATGLCVSIFALLVHTYFAQRMDKILTTMEKTEAVVIAGLTARGESYAT